jgi:hypothetical protein
MGAATVFHGRFSNSIYRYRRGLEKILMETSSGGVN